MSIYIYLRGHSAHKHTHTHTFVGICEPRKKGAAKCCPGTNLGRWYFARPANVSRRVEDLHQFTPNCSQMSTGAQCNGHCYRVSLLCQLKADKYKNTDMLSMEAMEVFEKCRMPEHTHTHPTLKNRTKMASSSTLCEYDG